MKDDFYTYTCKTKRILGGSRSKSAREFAKRNMNQFFSHLNPVNKSSYGKYFLTSNTKDGKRGKR